MPAVVTPAVVLHAPGTFEQFRDAFWPADAAPPPGLVRFHMLRGIADENEVITLGFFDGTLEDLERGQEEGDYRDRIDDVDPFVEALVVNGVYNIAGEFSAPAG